MSDKPNSAAIWSATPGMTPADNRRMLRGVRRLFIKTHRAMSKYADVMEAMLTTEEELAASPIYGVVCQSLGILEEEIAKYGNKLNKQ